MPKELDDLVARVRRERDVDLAPYLPLGADPDQLGRIESDVALLRQHPAIAGRVTVGGFLYDVDEGTLATVC